MLTFSHAQAINSCFGSYQGARGEAKNGSLDEIKCCGNVVSLKIG